MIVRNRFPSSLISPLIQRFTSSLTVSCSSREETLKAIIKPDQLPYRYWKNVLWVAHDLKKSVRDNNKQSLHLLDSSHVTLLFVKPHGRFQLAFASACDLLGARRTTYFDSNFENQPSAADTGRVLSKLTDMVITHGLHHDVLIKLISHTTIPIFSASCNVHCLQKALSDLMTYQEKLNRLRGITLAWVGPPNSLLNSYLLLGAQFGIRVRYTCICSFGAGRMSPVHRFSVAGGREDVRAEEFKTVQETIKGAHIIATSMHPEEKHKITIEALKSADPNWFFMHTLPRTSIEVTDEVFNHENNLSWETSENYVYIAMAVILTSLKSYQPKLNVPSCFDDDGDAQGQLPHS